MITKIYNIMLANGPLENDPEIDQDVSKAVRKASLALEYRYDILLRLEQDFGPIYTISLSSDDERAFKNIGSRLRGIAYQLLKLNKDKYTSMKHNTRLFVIKEVNKKIMKHRFEEDESNA